MKLILSTFSAFAVISISLAAVKGIAPTKKLNDGHHIPIMGLGTFPNLEWLFGSSELPRARQAMKDAVLAGFRHIDTSDLHGNEDEIGQGIADVIKAGLVTRDELYITTKLWTYKRARHQVVPALRESLQQLGLEYVDLYLIHTPQATDAEDNAIDIDFVETWHGMEEAKRLNLTRSIGVCDFSIEQIDRIIKNCSIVPAVNQIEIHPSFTKEKEVADCFERGITVEAYSPLGFFIKKTKVVNKKDPKILNIANKYKKTVPQVILRYEIDRNLIPMPRTMNANHLKDYIDVFDFQLTPEEIGIIGSFNKNRTIYEMTHTQSSDPKVRRYY